MNTIYIILITIASSITALTTIFAFLKKSNDKVNERIRLQAKEVAIEEANKERLMRETELNNLKESNKLNFKEIDKKLNKILEIQEKRGKDEDKINKLLKAGHIETWKNDIRTIYYNLRDTGSISDAEKSYVDKIYHLYKEMGGNSDIEAKYNEMVSVYKKRIYEKYDEAHENTKRRPGRPRKVTQEETKE